MTELRHALLQFPSDDGRGWLRFANPSAMLVAHNLDEVTDVLGEVERAARAGRWAVGFVGYDATPAFDPAMRARRHTALPLAAFGIFDRAWAASPPVAAPTGGGYEVGRWAPGTPRHEFESKVRLIKHYLARGDIYQANYTIRLHARFKGDPMGFFADLAAAQDADHCAYLDFGDQVICSASPELFFRRMGRRIVSRPMKGTAARHPEAVQDAATGARLVDSPKDRAENVMIVDMVRNDLGRVATVGSVDVTALYTLERYPTVHQLTSTVEAETDAGLVALFRALFPPASITGAPKIRSTQIIDDLETDARGVYAGCIGAVSPDGVAEFNVAIRTVRVDRPRGRTEYGVGGGIIWDSDPAAEWDEAVTKTRVLTHRTPAFQLLETMRYEPGAGVLLLERHVDRLERSADYFGFVWERERVLARLASLTSDEPVRVRLLCSASGACDLEVHELDAEAAGPWRLPVVTHAVQSDDVFLYHKTTHRPAYDAARACHPDAPDVILTNERGEVTETTLGNLVAEIGGELVSPPVSCGLLPGTARADLLEAGRIVERSIGVAELRAAPRLWLINSVRGWVEVELAEDGPCADADRASHERPTRSDSEHDTA